MPSTSVERVVCVARSWARRIATGTYPRAELDAVVGRAPLRDDAPAEGDREGEDRDREGREDARRDSRPRAVFAQVEAREIPASRREASSGAIPRANRPRRNQGQFVLPEQARYAVQFGSALQDAATVPVVGSHWPPAPAFVSTQFTQVFDEALPGDEQ